MTRATRAGYRVDVARSVDQGTAVVNRTVCAGQVDVQVQMQVHTGNGPRSCHGNGPYPWATGA